MQKTIKRIGFVNKSLKLGNNIDKVNNVIIPAKKPIVPPKIASLLNIIFNQKLIYLANILSFVIQILTQHIQWQS